MHAPQEQSSPVASHATPVADEKNARLLRDAEMKGDVKAISDLIRKGANLNSKDSDGKTP